MNRSIRLGATHALGGIGCDPSLLEPFLRRPGVQGEGVQTAFEFPLQCLVHQSMACHQAVFGEGFTDDHDLEMGLGPRGYIVHVALVRYLQVGQGEHGLQLFLDAFSTTHGLLTRVFCAAVSCAR